MCAGAGKLCWSSLSLSTAAGFWGEVKFAWVKLADEMCNVEILEIIVITMYDIKLKVYIINFLLCT